MKSFWDNLFYDLDECAITKEGFADAAGKEIRYDLQRIEDAIRGYGLQKAFDIIDECKKSY